VGPSGPGYRGIYGRSKPWMVSTDLATRDRHWVTLQQTSHNSSFRTKGSCSDSHREHGEGGVGKSVARPAVLDADQFGAARLSK